jgi:hypothetical protein
MRIVGFFVGLFLVICAVPIMIAAICNASFSATLTNEVTYQDAFANSTILENLVPVTLPALIETSNSQNLDAENSSIILSELNDVLTPEDWQDISDLVIPSTWLQTTYNALVAVMVGILNGDISVLSTTIDISVIRQNLQGETANQVADRILEVSPPCTRTQEDQIRTLASSNTGTLPICQPNGDLQPASKTALVFWLNRIGNSFETDSLLVSDYIPRDVANTISLFAKLDRQVLVLLYLCPVGLMALVVVFAVRSGKGFARWMGITTLVTGLLTIMWLLYLQVSLLAGFAGVFAVQNDIERFTAQIASSLLRATFSQAGRYMLTQAGVLVIIGFILLVAMTFIRNNTVTLNVGDTVLVTEDGQIISTATKKKI